MEVEVNSEMTYYFMHTIIMQQELREKRNLQLSLNDLFLLLTLIEMAVLHDQ